MFLARLLRLPPPLKAHLASALVPLVPGVAHYYYMHRGYATGETEQIEQKSPSSRLNVEPASRTHKLDGPMDVNYVQNNQPLPVPDDYPTAPSELILPERASVAIHTICAKAKISPEVHVEYRSRNASKEALAGKQDIKVCSLSVSIPGVSDVAVTGEGFTKQSAKQAAWLLAVSKMHLSGALKKLLHGPSSLSQPVVIDDAVTEVDKDAKIDIYNYAASRGMIPVFRTQTIQSAIGDPRKLYQTNIQLPGQEIDVTSTAGDPSLAEMAACVAFREEADKLKTNTNSSTTPAYSILNVHTARQFLDFYKACQGNVDINVEFEQHGRQHVRHTARLTLNGEVFGDTVEMAKKKKAESLAFLVAAVKVAVSRPALLEEFIQSRKPKGKDLQPLPLLDLGIGWNALQTMQQALINAKASGLPDERQTLKAEVRPGGADQSRRRRRLSAQEHSIASAQLKSRQKELESRKSRVALLSQTQTMPMNRHRQEVLSIVTSNQYSIIVGATGSGKTTQVPQILFEDAVEQGKGSSCNIICTQPRRIAATSVARRVALERGENLGDIVGYQVRFDSKIPRNPYGITYCTTGVLLEKLKLSPDAVLDESSHIIIDEVHERDLNIDFVIILLRRAINLRQRGGRSTPKVVLMSATLDSDSFARYLKEDRPSGTQQPCPILKVPGRALPVKEQYLTSILRNLSKNGEKELKTLLSEHNASEEYLKLERDFSASQRLIEIKKETKISIDWKQQRLPTVTESEEDAVNRLEKEEALVPISLVAATISHICTTSQDGAILVFLPGFKEILDVKQLLKQKLFSVDFTDESKFGIHLLHSAIPREEQDSIFRPADPGCRKIILSTNIAETSVTVPEVTFVVDTGKLNEIRYDPIRRTNKLQCVWESKSNLKQRAGRAGRVQDGFYYGLFSKERADSFQETGLCELLRADLQESCLSVKAHDSSELIASFLGQAIEPPPRAAVAAAISNLKQIGALTSDEQLTALGRVLSKLPVHPAFGKMIVLGIIFKCLDPMIVLGAAFGERALFLTPTGRRQEARTARIWEADDSRSDHIGYLKAFKELQGVHDQFGNSAAERRAREQYLDMAAFRNIQKAVRQILDILESSGLVQKQRYAGARYGPREPNQNSTNHELVKGLLFAAMYPNLAAKTSTKSLAYRTATEPALLIHPSSINSELLDKSLRHPTGTLFTYSNLLVSGNDNRTTFMSNTSLIHPLTAALFGGELRMKSDSQLEMDGWLALDIKDPFRFPPAKLVLEFRKALDRVLHGACSSLSEREPSWADDPVRAEFINSVVDILRKPSGSDLDSVLPSGGK